MFNHWDKARTTRYTEPVMPLPEQPRQPTVPTDAQIAEALGLGGTQQGAASSPPPPLWYAKPTAPGAQPRPSSGPVVTVAPSVEGRTFLDALKATVDHERAEVEATYQRERTRPDAWGTRTEALARIGRRYAFDVEAVENRATLAAAHAVEEVWAATLDELRALYGDAPHIEETGQ